MLWSHLNLLPFPPGFELPLPMGFYILAALLVDLVLLVSVLMAEWQLKDKEKTKPRD